MEKIGFYKKLSDIKKILLILVVCLFVGECVFIPLACTQILPLGWVFGFLLGILISFTCSVLIIKSSKFITEFGSTKVMGLGIFFSILRFFIYLFGLLAAAFCEFFFKIPWLLCVIPTFLGYVPMAPAVVIVFLRKKENK